MWPGLRSGRLSAETNPRRGRRTGHVPPWRRGPRLGAEAARLRRRRATPPLSKGRIRSRCWPTLLHHASQRPPHSWTAPALAPFHRARPPLLRRRSRRPRHCWMAPVQAAPHRARTPLLRRRSRRPRHCWMAARAGGVPSGTPATTAALQSAPAALLDGARAGGTPSGAPAATSAPKSAPAALLDGARVGGARSGAHAATSAPKFASGALADGSHAGGGGPGSPVATAAPQPALGVSPDGGPPDASAGAAAHTTREPVHSRHQSPPRRHIPAAVRRHIWQRDGGRCCYRDPLSGRRCTSSHLLQIDHLLPVAQGGWPGAVQSRVVVLCSSQNAPRLRTGCAAGTPDVALPARGWRAARLRRPTACRWPGGDTLRSPASPACICATASSDPGRSLSMRSRAPLSWSPVYDFLPLPAFAPDGFRSRAGCAGPPRWRRPPCSLPP